MYRVFCEGGSPIEEERTVILSPTSAGIAADGVDNRKKRNARIFTGTSDEF
jgi:hypothetical protein